MSYCSKCGQWVDDNSRFCQSCGEQNPNYYAAVQPVQADYAQPAEGAVQAPNGLNVMAIVAMALSELGLPGLILSIIALKRAKSGEYRVGLKPLAVAALIVSIFFLVFWICYLVFGVLFVTFMSNHGQDYIHYFDELAALI